MCDWRHNLSNPWITSKGFLCEVVSPCSLSLDKKSVTCGGTLTQLPIFEPQFQKIDIQKHFYFPKKINNFNT
jgi:hypothetical protein